MSCRDNLTGSIPDCLFVIVCADKSSQQLKTNWDQFEKKIAMCWIILQCLSIFVIVLFREIARNL